MLVPQRKEKQKKLREWHTSQTNNEIDKAQKNPLMKMHTRPDCSRLKILERKTVVERVVYVCGDTDSDERELSNSGLSDSAPNDDNDDDTHATVRWLNRQSAHTYTQRILCFRRLQVIKFNNFQEYPP